MTRRLIASGLFVFAASALVLSSAPTWAADSRFSQSITDLPLSSLRQDQYSDAIDAYAAKGQYQKAIDVADLGLRKNPKSAQLKFQRCDKIDRNLPGQKRIDAVKPRFHRLVAFETLGGFISGFGSG